MFHRRHVCLGFKKDLTVGNKPLEVPAYPMDLEESVYEKDMSVSIAGTPNSPMNFEKCV